MSKESAAMASNDVLLSVSHLTKSFVASTTPFSSKSPRPLCPGEEGQILGGRWGARELGGA